MAGIDRTTGKPLDGWPHVVQSLIVLFTTGYGARLMRRYFGSDVPRLLGANLTRRTVLLFVGALIVAVDLWEPRARVRKIDVDRGANSPENLRLGHFAMTVRCAFFPRGHLGDFTPAQGEYTLTIVSGNAGIIVS